MSRNKKKVLICGATGFIGKNVAEHFAPKNEFEVYGTYFTSEPDPSPRIEMIKVDLTNKEDVNRLLKGMDIVIQAAATTSGAKEIINKPFYHVTDNAVMNSLIFRSAHENKVGHVIFFSCSVMYQPGEVPVKESDFDANQEIFHSYFGVGWTKVYVEKMCEFYSRLGGVKYTVIRHSNIYGPYDKYDLDRSHVFGATIRKVMSADDDGTITIWGTGEEERDLLYVSDLVDFVDIAIEKQVVEYELVNVGYGSSISVSDLVKKIIKASGKNLNIKYDVSKPTIKTKLCLDVSKAAKVFMWKPDVSLDKGIELTLDWYRKNVHHS